MCQVIWGGQECCCMDHLEQARLCWPRLLPRSVVTSSSVSRVRSCSTCTWVSQVGEITSVVTISWYQLHSANNTNIVSCSMILQIVLTVMKYFSLKYYFRGECEASVCEGEGGWAMCRLLWWTGQSGSEQRSDWRQWRSHGQGELILTSDWLRRWNTCFWLVDCRLSRLCWLSWTNLTQPRSLSSEPPTDLTCWTLVFWGQVRYWPLIGWLQSILIFDWMTQYNNNLWLVGTNEYWAPAHIGWY